MKEKIIELESIKFSLYLVSCLLIVIALPLTTKALTNQWVNFTVLTFNIFAGLVLFYGEKTPMSIFLKILASAIIVSQVIKLIVIEPYVEKLYFGFFILFFLIVSLKVFRDIFNAEKIDIEILSAVFSGLIIIGIISTFAMVLVELSNPASFSGINPDEALFDNFIYFSFVSLLTIGYGDIVPKTNLAKTLIVIVGLAGYFYSIIITGIIIGKYIIHSKS